MIKNLQCGERTIVYELTYKKVKNINLRISTDGSVQVSANRRVPLGVVDAFVLSKTELIFKALQAYESRKEQPQEQYFAEEELRTLVLGLCEKAYPYYAERGIAYPQIKFRKMVSQWGNCRHTKGVLTFNTNLMYTPKACIEYVVWHEFTHFLQPNHSPKFYEELEKVCPHWKMCRKLLKEIHLR